MTDLGAGVSEHDEGPVNGRVGPGVPLGHVTCPACGLHDTAERTNHPSYSWLCGCCWTLFNGTDLEWRRMRTRREEAIERRDNPAPAVLPMRSHKVERSEPIAERVKENDTE